jgi:hypothetical protein
VSIDPTYDEWQDARRRVVTALLHPPDRSLEPHARALTEAALGPCPPEPAPVEWQAPGTTGELSPLLVTRHADGVGNEVLVGFPHIRYASLAPDEADAMAAALVEHARYAREQGAASA